LHFFLALHGQALPLLGTIATCVARPPASIPEVRAVSGISWSYIPAQHQGYHI
jgi:hypothetical protein